MVTERETVKGLLLELEQQLPLNQALQGSILESLDRHVVPVLDLSVYDPAVQTALSGSSSGPYGALIAIEAGDEKLTGLGNHTYVIESGGIPSGEIHVIKNLSINCDDATTREIESLITGFGLADFKGILAKTRTGGIGTKNVVGRLSDEGIAAEMLGQAQEFVMYEGMVLTTTVKSVASGKTTICSLIRERYSTTLTPSDVSADIDASIL